MSAAWSREPVCGQPPRLTHLTTTPAALVSIDVPGIPQAQGSRKPLRRGGKVVATHDNPRLRPWRDVLAWRVRAAMVGRPPVSGPVAVGLEFRLPRPKGHFGRRGLRPSAPSWPAVPPDADRLVRAVLDGLTEAAVWRDDGQVVLGTFAKRYCSDAEVPGVGIRVWALEQRADDRLAAPVG